MMVVHTHAHTHTRQDTAVTSNRESATAVDPLIAHTATDADSKSER